MQSSDSATPASTNATGRRKSGRAIQKPVLYQQDPNVSINDSTSGKRKRARNDEMEEDVDVADAESSLDEEESEPDEEELKEQRRRAARERKVPSKPATKRPRTREDGSVKLAMRPATNGTKKASKPKAPRARKKTVAMHEEGDLYGTYDSFMPPLCCNADRM